MDERLQLGPALAQAQLTQVQAALLQQVVGQENHRRTRQQAGVQPLATEALLQLREGGWSLVVPDQQLAVEHHSFGQCLRLGQHIGKSLVEQLLTP